MWLESSLSETLTFAKMEAASKKRVLENVAAAVAREHDNIDADALFQSLIGRERLGSTGIGEGIAIPHCRFNTGGSTICVCASLQQSVDYDAIDHEPVDLVFAMIVPEDEADKHLQHLAELARALQDPVYVKRLRNARNAHELHAAALTA